MRDLLTVTATVDKTKGIGSSFPGDWDSTVSLTWTIRGQPVSPDQPVMQIQAERLTPNCAAFIVDVPPNILSERPQGARFTLSIRAPFVIREDDFHG